MNTRKLKLEAAVNTAGYMQYPELVWLAKQAKKHKYIIEIGAYMGKSTRALGDNTDGFVISVDDFVGPRDAAMPDFLRDNLFEMYLSATADLLQQKKVIVMVENSHNVVVDFSPDMVFIDASHIYADVKKDIELWLPRMRPGGLLCGHDYTNMEDVRRAVNELLPKAKVAKGTSIWYVKT